MNQQPYPNHTGLSTDPQPVLNCLQTELSTISDLYSQVKHAHWNSKGPSFFAIHRLFDELAGILDQHIDELGERISTLGGYPMGYVSASAASSILDNPVDDLVQDLDWIAFILDQYRTSSQQLYSDIKTVTDIDPVSQDLLITIARDIDKGIYLLAAHLDDETDNEND